MVGLVLGHHLVAGHAVGHRVHDRPLRRGRIPPPLRFLQRRWDVATLLGHMRSTGLIDYVGQEVKATEELFPLI